MTPVIDLGLVFAFSYVFFVLFCLFPCVLLLSSFFRSPPFLSFHSSVTLVCLVYFLELSLYGVWKRRDSSLGIGLFGIYNTSRTPSARLLYFAST